MIELLMAGALLTAPLPGLDDTPALTAMRQDPPTRPAVQLEDVVVSGQPLDRLIRDFVGEVAEPNRNRGLAR